MVDRTTVRDVLRIESESKTTFALTGSLDRKSREQRGAPYLSTIMHHSFFFVVKEERVIFVLSDFYGFTTSFPICLLFIRRITDLRFSEGYS